MEIIYSVLEASMDGALKTHIMFNCNLNSRQLRLYLQFLVDKGLLSSDQISPSAKVMYKTSERGEKYMRAYETLLEMVGPRGSTQIQLSV